MEFLNITNTELDLIDLELESKKINSLEYQGYFTSRSGAEHYRLLSHISLNNNNITILDIGTLKGCSALAFGVNKTNTVYSFNLGNELDLNTKPDNIHFLIDDILKEEYQDLILKSKYIMLDTFHDGVFETLFLNHLTNINYKGFLLLDDINLNLDMINFWSKIDLEKFDITNIGHATGTGLVFFK
jgi:hypothetical protein